MEIRDLILRLKRADYKYSEAGRIKEELRKEPFSKQREVLNQLREEVRKSDNSDIIDVINDIINDLSKRNS